MATVTLYDAKTHLSDLINKILKTNETVLISRHGRAVAELRPVTKASRTKIDPVLSRIKINKGGLSSTEDEWQNV